MRTLLLQLFVLAVTTTFGQTRYDITLNANQSQCKEVLSELETELNGLYDRILTTNRISFSSTNNYSEDDILAALANIGISNATVNKDRVESLAIEKAGGPDCELAEQLCSSSSVPANSSGFGIQELPNNNTIDGCLSLEHQSSWYYINVQTGGSLSLRINPNSAGDDYDFAIWGPFTAANVGVNCPPITSPIRCSYSSTPGNTGIRVGEPDNSENSFGDRWVNALTVLSNEVYIVLIDNFSISGTGYSLDFNWGGNTTTAVIGCTPVVLPVEISSFSGMFQNGVNYINWSTETEINNDYFILETASEPDIVWKSVAVIDGAGNSETKKDYQFVHNSFKRDEINYYRIKQVDDNGSVREYSELIALDNTLEKMNVVKTLNLLGQEVQPDEKGIVIYVYEDGSIQKVMHLE